MELPPHAHPTEEMLLAYGLGKLDDASEAEVDAHLAACRECSLQLAGVPDDSFVGRLRAAQTWDGGSTRGTESPLETPPELAGHPHYRVVRELGRGGMGVVYLARNTLLHRLEVLKVLNPEALGRRGAAGRFEREVRAAARLSHPNVVAAYSAFPIDGRLVFAMEYVDGQDLAQVVKTLGPLPVADACDFAFQAALGLRHAHKRGMVHRDIKPSNLILARKGRGRRPVVKVLDFGLSKVDRGGPVDPALTREGQVFGTPDFIAPEQARDAQTADTRSDVYSLGCTLYYLLTGAPPFSGKCLYDLFQAHHSTEARPLDRVRPGVPGPLAAVVARMMAKDPAHRFQTPGEVARALRPFLNRPSGPVPVTTQPDRSAPRRRAWPWIAAALAALAVEFAVLELRTKEGVIVLEHLPAGSEVFIDGDHIRITERHNGTFSVSAPAGRHGVEVKQDGFWAFGEQVTIGRGQSRRIIVRLVPLPSPAPTVAEPHAWPEGLPLTGQKLPVRGRFLALSRAGRRLAVAPSDTELRVVAAPDAPRIVAIAGHTQYLWHADFRPDGRFLASAGNDNLVRVWDAETGDEVRQLRGHHGGVIAVAYSPDGSRIASGSMDRTIKIWDAETGAALVSLGTHADFIWCLAYSADGKCLASGSGAWDEGKAGPGVGELKLWDLETGACRDLEGHPMRVSSLSFSPDGSRLASASFDGTVKVWDLETRRCVTTFAKHQAFVTDVRFSPNGRLVASAGRETPMRVWDPETGREVVSLLGLPGPPGLVHFSPEGRWITSGHDSTLKVWEVPKFSPGPAPIPTSGVRPPVAETWIPLFNGKDLTGWKVPEGWKVEDGAIVSGGPHGFLVTERDDFANFHLRIEATINEQGNSGLILRTRPGPFWPDGYEAEITFHPGLLARTGSLNGFDDAALVTRNLAQPGEWFTQEVIADGDRLVVKVNGTVTASLQDRTRKFVRGALALQQFDPDTRARFRRVEIKELP